MRLDSITVSVFADIFYWVDNYSINQTNKIQITILILWRGSCLLWRAICIISSTTRNNKPHNMNIVAKQNIKNQNQNHNSASCCLENKLKPVDIVRIKSLITERESLDEQSSKFGSSGHTWSSTTWWSPAPWVGWASWVNNEYLTELYLLGGLGLGHLWYCSQPGQKSLVRHQNLNLVLTRQELWNQVMIDQGNWCSVSGLSCGMRRISEAEFACFSPKLSRSGWMGWVAPGEANMALQAHASRGR